MDAYHIHALTYPTSFLRYPQARARPQARRPAARQLTTRAMPVEVAQVAGEAGFIAGTAATMFGITLVGLALGFVLLRVGK